VSLVVAAVVLHQNIIDRMIGRGRMREKKIMPPQECFLDRIIVLIPKDDTVDDDDDE
jgi:hypothetical protein